MCSPCITSRHPMFPDPSKRKFREVATACELRKLNVPLRFEPPPPTPMEQVQISFWNSSHRDHLLVEVHAMEMVFPHKVRMPSIHTFKRITTAECRWNNVRRLYEFWCPGAEYLWATHEQVNQLIYNISWCVLCLVGCVTNNIAIVLNIPYSWLWHDEKNSEYFE